MTLRQTSAPASRRPGKAAAASAFVVRLAFAAALALLFVGGLNFALDGGVRQAEAQWSWGGWGGRDPRYQQPERRPRVRVLPEQQERRSGFGFPFFNWGRQPSYRVLPDETEPERRPRQAVDSSRPPPPKKADAEPAKTVLVLGDAMADWLGYGLEEAFSDTGEFGAVRKPRTGSSLIRNEPRDFDWAQNAREILAGERADFVVMMIGLGDRHAFKERPAAKTPTTGQPTAAKPGEPAQPTIIAPEAERQAAASSYDFRSEKWGELYTKRVDEVIAILKSKRVPVLWVGLPPIRGTKARADVAYLNDIYRAAAEKAGITYVDVWEGFTDDSGEYANYGPDVMGQVRRLRTGDGVYFTKPGARKLAHFVDREIRRLLNRETPIALPIPDMPEKAPEDLSGPAPRPVAGPVVPLTGSAPVAETLLGGSFAAPRDPNSVAAKVLVNGEPPLPTAGRADSFAWPPSPPMAANDIVAPPPEAPAVAARPLQPAGGTTVRRPRPATTGAGAPARTQARPVDAQAAAPGRAVR